MAGARRAGRIGRPEGRAAAAGRDRVRVVHGEAGTHERVDVVDLGAAEEVDALRVDVDLDPRGLEDLVLGGRGVLDHHPVAEAGAATRIDVDAQADVRVGLFGRDLPELAGGCIGEAHDGRAVVDHRFSRPPWDERKGVVDPDPIGSAGFRQEHRRNSRGCRHGRRTAGGQATIAAARLLRAEGRADHAELAARPDEPAVVRPALVEANHPPPVGRTGCPGRELPRVGAVGHPDRRDPDAVERGVGRDLGEDRLDRVRARGGRERAVGEAGDDRQVRGERRLRRVGGDAAAVVGATAAAAARGREQGERDETSQPTKPTTHERPPQHVPRRGG